MSPNAEGTVGLIEVAPGVRRMTAPNPGRLTAEGTHSFVLGRGSVVVVDPGPFENDGHVARLIGALEGERIAGMAVTHRHQDHVGGVVEMAVETGAEVLTPAQLADHGVETLAAPGHTSDHLAFRFGDALLTGDHVFEHTSTLIDWPDGSVSAFLETTRALRDLAHLSFHPAHGPQLSDPAARLDWLIRHREDRNRAILDALRGGPASINGIFDLVYADAPRSLRKAAFGNLTAHLDHLEHAGLIISEVRGPTREFLLRIRD
jgi:glyoxylase-like metal-dependent hydrolase (beta-lactamase superfamily II)